MMRGPGLIAWARGEAQRWFDARHDPKREPLEGVIAAAYLRGAVDALKDETARILCETATQQIQRVGAQSISRAEDDRKTATAVLDR